MYKIIVVDDEYMERMAISHILQNSGLPITIVGEAADGLEAEKMFFELSPNIVLIDIKMPGKDGLEVVYEMLKSGSEAAIIFLTAYDEFEYAQKAVRLGAFDYILKPARPEEVVKVVNRAIKELENSELLKAQYKEMEMQNNLIKPYVKSSLVFNLISGNYDSEDLKKMSGFLGMDHFGQIALVIGLDRQKDNDKDNYIKKMHEAKQKVFAIINEEKQAFSSVLMTYMGMDKVVVLLSVKEDKDDHDIEHLVREWASTIQKKFSQTDLGSITIGIGESINRLGQIRESYLQARKACKIGSLLLEGNQLLNFKDIEEDQYLSCSYEKERILHNHVVNREWDSVKLNFKEWFIEVAKLKEPLYMKKARITEMIVVMSRAAIDEGANQGKIFGLVAKFYNKLNLSDYLIDMVDYSACIIQDFEELIRDCHKTYSEKIIMSAIEYIEKNYCNNIGMCDVAKEVNLSPHYFSRLFKKEKDVTFLDYMTQMRIDKAKQLLRDPSMSINEVAQKIGYYEACYFSRVFKKYEKLSPSEYRVKLSKSSN